MLNSKNNISGPRVSGMLRPGIWLAIFLFSYNNVVNFIPPTLHSRLYVWMNLGILVIVWLWSRRYLDLHARDLGLTKQNSGKSILLSFGLTGLVVLPFIVLLWLLPGLGFDLKTPRLEEIAQDIFWWRIFVRIPLGTALFEELLFRGIFYGYLMKRVSEVKAILITSLFFAFWHITPAFKVVSQDLHVTSTLLFITLWLVLLLGSFVAGVLFAWIRYRTKNIAGCFLAHALINVLSLISAFAVWK